MITSPPTPPASPVWAHRPASEIPTLDLESTDGLGIRLHTDNEPPTLSNHFSLTRYPPASPPDSLYTPSHPPKGWLSQVITPPYLPNHPFTYQRHSSGPQTNVYPRLYSQPEEHQVSLLP